MARKARRHGGHGRHGGPRGYIRRTSAGTSCGEVRTTDKYDVGKTKDQLSNYLIMSIFF